MTSYMVQVDGLDEGEWLDTDYLSLAHYLEHRFPDAETIAVFEKDHGACLFAKWRDRNEIKSAWGADVDQHEWTNDKVPSCLWCGEWTVPLREMYSPSDPVPQEYICKDCFSDDVICWDDLGPVVNEWALAYARTPEPVGGTAVWIRRIALICVILFWLGVILLW